MREPAIRVKELVKHYGSTVALDGVSLQVQPGEFFGLLGPNGAGKSTLINILAGPTRRSSGEARVYGHDVEADYRLTRSLIGVVPQELVYDHYFTVERTLRYHSGYFGVADNRTWCRELMGRLDLWEHRKKNVNHLSGGMKRRLLVAKALVHHPQVLILDEPTAGVDVSLRRTLWEFVREIHAAGTTVVLTTHYLHEAEELCERIAILDRGRVVALDRKENLVRLTGKKTVLIDLARPLAGPVRSLAGQPPEVEADGRRLVFRFDPGTDDLDRWLAAIREEGLEIADITVRAPALEDVFLEVTGLAEPKERPEPEPPDRGEERW